MNKIHKQKNTEVSTTLCNGRHLDIIDLTFDTRQVSCKACLRVLSENERHMEIMEEFVQYKITLEIDDRNYIVYFDYDSPDIHAGISESYSISDIYDDSYNRVNTKNNPAFLEVTYHILYNQSVNAETNYEPEYWHLIK